MTNQAVLLCIAILIIAAAAAWFLWGRAEAMVTSSVDHEEYSVLEEYANAGEAANILARINGMYVRLITHLKRTVAPGSRWAGQVEYLCQNYNPTVIGEHIPWSLRYTSYVDDKGKKVRFCLRLPADRNKFHDETTLHFVALHELAHLMTRSYGHDNDFWDTFRFLLIEANRIGEIKLVDYRRKHQPYCGITIESNPALDR